MVNKKTAKKSGWKKIGDDRDYNSLQRLWNGADETHGNVKFGDLIRSSKNGNKKTNL